MLELHSNRIGHRIRCGATDSGADAIVNGSLCWRRHGDSWAREVPAQYDWPVGDQLMLFGGVCQHSTMRPVSTTLPE